MPQYLSPIPNVEQPALVAAPGAAAVTTGVTSSSPFGFVGATQGDRLSVLVNELRTAVIAIIAVLVARGDTAAS